jgi:hypothetical protein
MKTPPNNWFGNPGNRENALYGSLQRYGLLREPDFTGFFEAMKKQCVRCNGNFFRRLNRSGYMERTVLPFLGFFPWECALCRRKVILRTDGFKAGTKPAAASTPTMPGGWLAASLVLAGRKHRQ